MCSDVTVMMAVKKSIEDSRTDWSVRDSGIVASKRYRDSDVLNLRANVSGFLGGELENGSLTHS